MVADPAATEGIPSKPVGAPPLPRNPADPGVEVEPGERPNALPASGALQRVPDDASFRYRLSIWCARALSRFVWALPKPTRDFLATLGGRAFFRLSRTYRENVASNLRQVLGPEVDQAHLEAAVRGVFLTSARNFADLLMTPRLSRQSLLKAVNLSANARATLDAAMAEGRGVVIVSAHLGAFDFVGQGLHLYGYPLTVVTARTTSRFVFDGVTYLRGSQGPAMVEATPTGLRRAIQALRRGECTAILVDRDFFQNGRPVIFFGRETTLPVGAIRMAREARAPIVPVLTLRTASGNDLYIYDPIRVDRTTDPDADLMAALRQLASVLEDAIGSAPDQWVMFQRVWPEGPADPVRAFPVGSPFAPESARPPAAGWRDRLVRIAAKHRHGG